MKSIRIGLPAVALCVVLGACGESATPPSVNPSGGPSLSTVKPSDPNAEPPLPPANSTAPASPRRPSPGWSPGGSAPTGTFTVTGVITQGVEPNCMLIDNYLLIGGPREQLRAGARVTVTGRLQPGLMTTCQQGTPLVVESAKPA
ncbi:hypothetical protein BDK92_2838 [Micromonospora pisi]|uniref:Nucleic acid binding protein n=1 Tax=Micromonospora pisi TaxID=589240 RepID=A0A495JHI3_9ACTN|nr:hypothetical protein [Micromonospora pisi]RKR88510.1 hypothetical protein BDK92_2838 [Micromonospora pisi]